MSRINAYSMETRRLVVTKYRYAASIAWSTDHRVLIGHQLVAQLVVGGVQREGEGDGDALLRQLVDGGDEPDGRHDDAAGGHAEPVGRAGR